MYERNKPKPLADIKCFACGKAGHKRQECTTVKTRETRIVCAFCKIPGHVEEICRKKARQSKYANLFLGSAKQDSIYCKRAKINNVTIECFVDLGSACTLIRCSMAKKIQLTKKPLDRSVKLYGFSGDNFVWPIFECTANITIEGVTVMTHIYVVNDEDSRIDLLVGQTFTEHPSVLIIKTRKALQISKLPTLDMAHEQERSIISCVVDLIDRVPLTKSAIGCSNISEKQKTRLFEVLIQYSDTFSSSLCALGKTHSAEMKIDCLSDKPVVYAPYRLSFSERDSVKKMIAELLNSQIIRESRSPYASPILLVKKKDGTPRMCVDFRALNRVTKKDKYPLPIIDDQIDRLGGYKYFTTLDLMSGFYQVPMSTDSIEKTGFVTPDGHYEFLRMPFGLTNAPAVFQRLMNTVLGVLCNNIAYVYIDDVIIPSLTFKEGLERLKLILEKFRQHRLTIKMTKCRFLETTINYLGREISASGVRPGVGKINALERMSAPRRIKQVRQFLGLAGYFRKFIGGFATIAQPYALLKKENAWRLGRGAR